MYPTVNWIPQIEMESSLIRTHESESIRYSSVVPVGLHNARKIAVCFILSLVVLYLWNILRSRDTSYNQASIDKSNDPRYSQDYKCLTHFTRSRCLCNRNNTPVTFVRTVREEFFN